MIVSIVLTVLLLIASMLTVLVIIIVFTIKNRKLNKVEGNAKENMHYSNGTCSNSDDKQGSNVGYPTTR